MCVWGGGGGAVGGFQNCLWGHCHFSLLQEGIYLVLIGLGLPIIPVFLIWELLLIVLIHVHLPEAG